VIAELVRDGHSTTPIDAFAITRFDASTSAPAGRALTTTAD